MVWLGGGVRIGVGKRLGGGEAVVADLPQRLGDRGVIEVPQPGGPAVGIDEMDVADVPAPARIAAGTFASSMFM